MYANLLGFSRDVADSSGAPVERPFLLFYENYVESVLLVLLDKTEPY